MRYTNLGRTGLRISAIALGCANFGGMGSVPALFGKVTTREEAFAILDKAWELGINYFDTAIPIVCSIKLTSTKYSPFAKINISATHRSARSRVAG